MHQTEICWLFFLRSYRAADDYLHYKELCFWLSVSSIFTFACDKDCSVQASKRTDAGDVLALTLANWASFPWELQGKVGKKSQQNKVVM